MRRNTVALILAVAAAATLGLATILAGYVVARAAGGGTMMGRGASGDRGGYGAGSSACDAQAGPQQRRGLFPGPRSGSGADSLEEAAQAFENYVERLRYDGLHLTEVMEFERNYYAIVAEEDTGMGAMELVLDKGTGVVTPEQGPNMMWNIKYGMHGGGGMMGRSRESERMTLSPEEAIDEAQSWLDAELPGSEAGEPDAFYGYYTLHFTKDGRVEGMLSVNGSTGQVWYHNWHGDFVRMTEHDD